MKQERWISRYILALLLIFSIAITLSSCGSGGGNSGGGNSIGGNSSSENGGGGNSGGSGGGGLATGTFTKTVEITGSTWPAQFSSTFATIRYMHMYHAANISGSGNITAIRFQYGNNLASAVTCPNTTIKLAHTNLSDLTSTYNTNIEQGAGSSVTVVNNASVVIPAGSDGNYFDIPLSTSFYYNGVDNLVIEIRRPTACSGTVPLREGGVGYVASIYSVASDTATTGTTISDNISASFVFAGGDNAVIPATGTVTNNTFPFNTNPSWGRKVQLLYPVSAINGSGPITGIGMIVDTATSAQEYTMTVRLGHSTLTDLTSTFNNNYSDTPVTVANGVVFRVPAGVPSGETIWFPLPGTFTYNGTSNLIVEIDVTNNSSATSSIFLRENDPVGNNVRVFGNTGGSTGNVDQQRYHVVFRFNGGTMNILNGGTTGEAAYFDSSNNGRAQYLLLASELGTSGNITSFACRIINPNATALNYTNTMVILAHTANKSLSSTFASNLAGGVTVFSGTYTMPGNILEGDYFKIPFSTPFAYNGMDNLVVSIQSNGGGAGVNCKLATDAVRFADQRLATANYANAAGSLSNYKPNVSITYSK